MTTAIIAAHLVFVWVLGISMNSKVVDKFDDKPKAEARHDSDTQSK